MKKITLLSIFIFAIFTFAHADLTNEALFKAAAWGDVNLLNSWIRQGKNLDIRDKYGNTPLIIACESGKTEFVERLINAGADVNVENDHGYTPLLSAMAYNHIASIGLLAAAGADINKENNFGRSPKSYMDLSHSKDIHDYLKYQIENDNNTPYSIGPNALLYLKGWQKDYMIAEAEKNRKEMFDIMYINAENGDPQAAEMYGLYLAGKNQPEKALKYLSISSGQNMPESMYVLGGIYVKNGEPAKGHDYICAAADAGYEKALSLCGEGYMSGAADYSAALKYFNNAYESGDYLGLYYIGIMKYYGMGVPVDKVQGLIDIQKAAHNDVAEAKRQLARFNTEDAFNFLSKYQSRSRGHIRAYLVSQGAVLSQKDFLCDTYTVNGYFDNDYGVKSLKFCYPENSVQTLEIAVNKDVKPIYTEFLLNFGEKVPVTYIME